MNDKQEEHRKAVALFRYGLISDLLHSTPRRRGEAQELLNKKAEQDYSIPGSRRTRVAAETIRDWLKHYRKGGFDGLLPKPRSDIGSSHSIPKDIQDLLLMMKEEHPEYSVPLLIVEARAVAAIPETQPLPPSTVHRLLSRHGLMDKKAKQSAQADHRRFEFEKAGQLWMSDVMHGPAVLADGKRKRKTYLIAFLDDATRVVPYAQFAFSESTAAFLPVLKQAVLRRGVPERLFVDNGSAFRSQQLAIAAAKLGITLIHGRPYHPQGKGKIERFFRTTRSRLLTRLTEHDLCDLQTLNRRLWAWVEGEYHQTPHSSLEETPLERWAQRADEVRSPSSDIEDLVLFEAKRKVARDRTVNLEGCAYEVEAHLVGRTVVLRYEPDAAARKSIQVWLNGQQMQIAKPVDTRANCFVKRDRPAINLSAFENDREVF